jgi:bacteriorhodopsin
MFTPQYQTVPSGSGNQGSARKWKLDGTLQEGTFITSMVMQFVTLVVSFIALVQGNMPPVLNVIVWLELIVQCVELVWYSWIAYRYLEGGDKTIPIHYRYFDWVITTPIMMTSITLFVLWDADKDCDAVLNEGSRIAALVIIILMDLLMLGVGFAYESKWEALAPFRNFYDMLLCNFRPNAGLWLGWVPFIGVFIPLFVIIGQPKTNTGWGLTSVLLTFGAWALYGVVALLGSEGVWMDETRNTAYNVLDIFSKNAVGLIVSSVAIGNDFNMTSPNNCTTF